MSKLLLSSFFQTLTCVFVGGIAAIFLAVCFGIQLRPYPYIIWFIASFPITYLFFLTSNLIERK